MHKPVLLHEVSEGLAVESGDTVLDLTLGGGGHAQRLCEDLGGTGTLIGIDLDKDALEAAKKVLQGCAAKVILKKENFRNLDSVLDRLSITSVQRILFDLGLRSEQLERSGRGFSFLKDEPLLMTFYAEIPEGQLTAYEIVNYWSEKDIGDILARYGEERYARRIARLICETRTHGPLKSTYALVGVIERAVPRRSGRSQRIHPATRTFQALRIAVNDELGALEEALAKASAVLSPGGRIAVISFHSLEDRIVKVFFKQKAAEGAFHIVTGKPIVPSEAEIRVNPRARSSKLRIAEKTLEHVL